MQVCRYLRVSWKIQRPDLRPAEPMGNRYRDPQVKKPAGIPTALPAGTWQQPGLMQNLNNDYVYAWYIIFLNWSHTLSSRPDKSDQAFLVAWSRLVSICPSLQDLLKNVTTEKGQDQYANALNKVCDHCTLCSHTDFRLDRFWRVFLLLGNITQLSFETTSLIGFFLNHWTHSRSTNALQNRVAASIILQCDILLFCRNSGHVKEKQGNFTGIFRS